MAQGITIPEHLKKKPVEKPDHNKRKGWSTPYGFIDFRQPVTYEVALAEMEKLQEYAAKMFNKGENNEKIMGD